MTHEDAQLITIKEARKLLGKEYSHMSDEEVKKLVEDLSILARLALEDARKKLAEGTLRAKDYPKG